VAQRESWRKEVFRPVYHMHKWWAKRLGSVFRTLLIAGLSDPGSDVWEAFYQAHDFRGKVVLDPFMGGGTTLGEALKLGASVVGCDINPVSAFLVKRALEPADLPVLHAAFARLEARYRPRVARFYASTWPATGETAQMMYTFWVMTAPCPAGPGRTRLFSRWVFAQDARPAARPEAWCLCPACGEISQVRYDAAHHTCPACRQAFDPQAGPAQRTVFVCEVCGERHPVQKTVAGTGEPPRYEMYAHLLLLSDGTKVYKATDDADRAQYQEAEHLLKHSAAPYPRDRVQPGVNTDQLLGYNLRRWDQLFNARQLLTLSWLLGEILKEEDEGARALLILLFSGSLEFNTMLCSYKGEGTGAVRHTFSHHILKPERTPLENHPWGTPRSSGTFSTLFNRRLLAGKAYCEDPTEVRVFPDGRAEQVGGINRPIRARLAADFAELRAGTADALILSGSSADLPLPDASVDLVITDPPYFDLVNYAELADFFHVWLRLALPDDPSFRPETTRHPQEVQAQDPETFGRNLAAVFAECARVLKPGGRLAFTFHHKESAAWEAVVRAVRVAGLEVTAVHPVKAEQSVSLPKARSGDPIDLDAVLVCRHRTTPDPDENKADGSLPETVLARVSEVTAALRAQGVVLSPGDVRVIALGTLAVLARHEETFGAAAAAVLGALSPGGHGAPDRKRRRKAR